jgi:hypothetical protein
MSVEFHAANLRPELVRTFAAGALAPSVQSETGRWLWHTDLGPVVAGTIVVPSLTIADGEPYGFRFALDTDAGLVRLPGFGEFSRETPPSASDHVSTHIDYFTAISDLTQASLVLEVESTKPPHERPILVGVSRRKNALDIGEPEEFDTTLIDAPALCQRDAPPEIALRICSPTCIAMVLRYFGVAVDLLELARSAYDRASGIYGVWPQGLYAASRHGFVGAVRTFEALDSAAEVLADGLPLVASVSYANGELDGAALSSTEGHLVVICGFRGDHVIVNDPVAENRSAVRRAYPLDQFARVWLRNRGAGYVLAPLS